MGETGICLSGDTDTHGRGNYGGKAESTEAAEDFLLSLGFTDFRVRRFGEAARLQFPASQLGRALEKREEIVRELKRYYKAVLLDMEART